MIFERRRFIQTIIIFSFVLIPNRDPPPFRSCSKMQKYPFFFLSIGLLLQSQPLYRIQKLPANNQNNTKNIRGKESKRMLERSKCAVSALKLYRAREGRNRNPHQYYIGLSNSSVISPREKHPRNVGNFLAAKSF